MNKTQTQTQTQTSMPAWLAPAIGAGASLIGSIFGGSQQQKQNRQQNRFIDEQNQKNRDFQIDMFNKTNEYNTPAMQMQRFKEAGLNPNLIYGQGSTGNATAVSAPAQETKQAFKPTYGKAFEAAQQYINMRQQESSMQNQSTQRRVMEEDIHLKNAQSAKALAEASNVTQNTRFAHELQEYAVKTASQNVINLGTQNEKMQAEIMNTIANTENGKKMTNAQVSKIAQDIVQSKQQVKILEVEGRFKEADIIRLQLDNQLRKEGIQPSDSPLLRIPLRQFSGEVKTYINDVKGVKEGIKNFFKSKKIGGRNLWDLKKTK